LSSDGASTSEADDQFLSNRVPGQDGWSLKTILRVTFGGWPIEDCYREANAQAAGSHHKTRRQRLLELGIKLDKIKTIFPKQPL
jgi:hypothetical protein